LLGRLDLRREPGVPLPDRGHLRGDLLAFGAELASLLVEPAVAGGGVPPAGPGDGELLPELGDPLLLGVLLPRLLAPALDRRGERRLGLLAPGLELRHLPLELGEPALALEHAGLGARALDVNHAAVEPDAVGREE